MQTQAVIDHIVQWLQTYREQSGTKGFVVGISGGIDSALTSTLCALTGARTLVASLPIRQHAPEHSRAKEHMDWLTRNFKNAETIETDLGPVFNAVESTFPKEIQDHLTMANTRSRLRMTTLYAYACHHQLLVAGTGNKVEDFGVGFFTKYGDGGVDLSPIADLMKSEVRLLAKHLRIPESILKAPPTDGLFADGRSDEDQIGASYDELEWAMDFENAPQDESGLSLRQQEVLGIYRSFNRRNRHKMAPIPVCSIPTILKK